MIKYFIIYLIIVNLIAFIAMYLDKRKARYGKWRIPEQSLLVLALIGGSIGSIIGMYSFRHKTSPENRILENLGRSKIKIY